MYELEGGVWDTIMTKLKIEEKKIDVLKKLLLISTYFVFVLNITNVERERDSVSQLHQNPAV